MSWNFDISKAPRGSYVVVNRKFGKGQADTRVFKPDRVILATKCGKVTLSKYLPDEKRWEMLAVGEQPVAWMAWPVHPHSEIEGERTHLDRGTPAAPSMQGEARISEQPNKGGSDAKSADDDIAFENSDLIDRRRREHGIPGSFGPAATHDETPRESAAEGISRPFSPSMQGGQTICGVAS